LGGRAATKVVNAETAQVMLNFMLLAGGGERERVEGRGSSSFVGMKARVGPVAVVTAATAGFNTTAIALRAVGDGRDHGSAVCEN
jgi:hypothetical protein